MRWTNYFIHPGDNRYYVFSFREDVTADEFGERLDAAKISYERHRENELGKEEWLFGVHRTFFKEALHANHLVHAAHREKFIPIKGFRYALLIGTLAVLALALVGAFISSAQGQTLPKSSPWNLSVTSSVLIPLEAAGFEPVSASSDGLNLTWMPQGGSSFGARIHRDFSSGWGLEWGLESMRMSSDWALTFQPGFSQPNNPPAPQVADTLTLRAGRYRVPLMAATRVPIDDRFTLSAAAGFCIDFLLSDVMTTGYQQSGAIFDDYSVEENRQHRWTAPLRAEVGSTWMPRDASKIGCYLGVAWWREWNQNRWGHAEWKRLLEKSDVRIFMPQSAFAMEIRLILP